MQLSFQQPDENTQSILKMSQGQEMVRLFISFMIIMNVWSLQRCCWNKSRGLWEGQQQSFGLCYRTTVLQSVGPFYRTAVLAAVWCGQSFWSLLQYGQQQWCGQSFWSLLQYGQQQSLLQCGAGG
jgi:hypothetical protein